MKAQKSTRSLVSITSGKMLCDSFSEVHETAEFIAGHPIWTHEFADRRLTERLRELVLKQHPDLDIDASDINRENAQQMMSWIDAEFGESRTVTKGQEQRATDPISSLVSIIG